MTKKRIDDTKQERDRPVKLLDEIEFEIRMWDSDRELTQAQLAERLFDIAREGK